ncbi:redox-regulated molecular chaperone Hsp33 [Pusillimonas sp. TS35]|uniref:Hsp33 family molecular chaperone HslO n=1 Tax=Paracandidimonas lactea TaxID=2895524 RepID=UPI00136DAD1F|nr:Hsp33 family molecular chaperone HslO [Paracandidimonas lactea]MYN11543.1 redox-regulated molecular chaperone Hsp33 [Pusillimonas sp. TS35]
MNDQLQKFLSPDNSTRVQAVRVTSAWQTGLAHQQLPGCVQRLLGELVSAAVLLASNIKFDGSLVLQLQGDGPIALVVVECTADLSIRATASLREGQQVPEEGSLQSLLNTQGKGQFIVVLDPTSRMPGMSPYQGVVPLEGDTVAEVLQAYMRNSEQLDTRLWLAADGQRSAGLLLQKLPRHGGHRGGPEQSDLEACADETWSRLTQLAQTVQADELLELDTAALMHRLFWQESLTAFDPQPVRWHCPCSRERVAGMLRTLGREEVEDILQEFGQVNITCNFCGKPYAFDNVDCAELFIEHPGAHGSRSALH